MSFASNSNSGIDSNLWQNRKLPQLHIIASNEGHCQIIHRKRFNFTHIISTSYFMSFNGASFLLEIISSYSGLLMIKTFHFVFIDIKIMQIYLYAIRNKVNNLYYYTNK